MVRLQRASIQDRVLMTTWHQDESLEEAFWFFNTLAVPTEAPFASEFQRFAVAIGNPGWAEAMKRALGRKR